MDVAVDGTIDGEEEEPSAKVEAEEKYAVKDEEKAAA